MRRTSRGYLTLARARRRGVAVELHWSLAVMLGVILLDASAGACVGWLAVVLAHELGHAAFVRFVGLRTSAIRVHGLGGECEWRGHASIIQRAFIAWGGVAGQIALLLPTALLAATVTPPTAGTFQGEVFHAFVHWNVAIAAFNLVPIPPLDGVWAWRLPSLLRRRRRLRRGEPARRPPGPRVELGDEEIRDVLLAVDEQLAELTQRANARAREER